MLTEKAKQIDVFKIKKDTDIQDILDLYDGNEITKDELRAIWFMTLSVSSSEGHTRGFELGRQTKLITKQEIEAENINGYKKAL